MARCNQNVILNLHQSTWPDFRLVQIFALPTSGAELRGQNKGLFFFPLQITVYDGFRLFVAPPFKNTSSLHSFTLCLVLNCTLSFLFQIHLKNLRTSSLTDRYWHFITPAALMSIKHFLFPNETATKSTPNMNFYSAVHHIWFKPAVNHWFWFPALNNFIKYHTCCHFQTKRRGEHLQATWKAWMRRDKRMSCKNKENSLVFLFALSKWIMKWKVLDINSKMQVVEKKAITWTQMYKHA